jgi:hypothetical protein
MKTPWGRTRAIGECVSFETPRNIPQVDFIQIPSTTNLSFRAGVREVRKFLIQQLCER